ncbi:MAG: helix-turn-helix transcriptional regulator [Lewinellaceae bacterium]|nr:helix-turn-helix transcriptional regulator [Lewinellaceae bacterium]
MVEHATNPKYQNLLKTGRELFWKHGVKRVTIEEICRESGVSKVTFYRFFPNKIELAKTILQGMFDDAMGDYRALMAEDIPFEEKVRKQLLLKFEGTKEISAELVRDIYSNQEWGLGAYMEARTEEALQVIMDDYAQAQKKGWIRKDLNLGFVLYIFHKMPEWIFDQHLLSAYETQQDLIMEIANFFFYGILPHSKNPND